MTLKAEQFLPPYLLETEPLEAEHLPLQVSLLTMELASQRQQIATLTQRLNALRVIVAIDEDECDG
jgi:hypothetical protein